MTSRKKVPGKLTLNESDRRILAAWAADCAARTLPIFERVAPNDKRPRDAIEAARAFARDEMKIGAAKSKAVAAHAAARSVAQDAAAVAAARSCGHAVATAHMAAHARGVSYSAVAVGTERANDEVEWQFQHSSPQVRDLLSRLPAPQKSRAAVSIFQNLLQTKLQSAVNDDNESSIMEPVAKRRRKKDSS